jgi:hypothetical protein
MVDPTQYVADSLIWATVWAAGGLAVRQFLARREMQQRNVRHESRR